MIHTNQNKLQKLFKSKGILGNITASVFASVTPFCACSTIPMTVGFLNANLPFGAVLSFLISSPLLNPIIISMLGATVGVKNAVIYFVMAFSISVLFGYILDKMGYEKYVKSVTVSGIKNNTKMELIQEENFS